MIGHLRLLAQRPIHDLALAFRRLVPAHSGFAPQERFLVEPAGLRCLDGEQASAQPEHDITQKILMHDLYSHIRSRRAEGNFSRCDREILVRSSRFDKRDDILEVAAFIILIHV
ncbi:MAG TPA: hypothetical protein VM639_10775 [Dongiaceae bacterium]|nr:hypothetical protein [Dongiaceae bacterium]